jgi:hypothetical protein
MEVNIKNNLKLNKMKKLITMAAGALCALPLAAQDVTDYRPGDIAEGVVYYLPKTELEVELTIAEQAYTPGELCQFANRYLHLTDVADEAATTYRLQQVKVSSVGVPDPDNAYAVKQKDKSLASQVTLTRDGILKAIHASTDDADDAPAADDAPQVTGQVTDPRKFLTEDMLLAGSSYKMADLVAKEIYAIRDSKSSLTRGQADYMPADGAALQLMLTNLDEQERSLTSLFAGTTIQTVRKVRVRLTPATDGTRQLAFRFSQRLGVVAADNLAGEPYYLTVTNLNTLPAAAEKPQKKPAGIIYNVPGKAEVTVQAAGTTYFKGELPITQLGATEVLATDLFTNKKIDTKVVFNPHTGAIVKIEKE